ncbi:hypothetical protein SAMN04489806_0307 [Paramicrobacterium humi]|uniref:DUF2332 domain-containing protein n=1 Tax=Paramicrobacterium humi TaxID=640635 RepID=A0A1H4IXB8_9MICO|nr:DUF2332 domain-containing protein [Microbacterium humi]SEB37968.1 hypothetical protein SAMN04489806_0307 [Microbacterium humi]
MQPLDDDNLLAVSDRYARFARSEAHGNSAFYEAVCEAIAVDEELCARIAELPPAKQQPNLVLASARYLDAPEHAPADFTAWLVDAWPRVRAVALEHRTQTNEPNRTGVLLTLLAQIDGPVALIEVGASGGLCLFPDRYSHTYDDAHRLDPDDGRSAVVTRCETTGAVPFPTRMPRIVSRTGVDLHPLDVSRPEDARWLRALVWPGQREREERLDAAIGIARTTPPALIEGDLNERIGDLVAAVPSGVTPVVQHTAVLAYLDAAGRDRFFDQMRSLPARWISYEGRGVFPRIDAQVPGGVRADENRFIVSFDARPVAFAAPHGQRLDWM